MTDKNSETDNAKTSIRHFKLSSGEEIVAIIGARTPDGSMLLVEHPMLVRTSITETGFTFMFSVWQPLTDDNMCLINPLHIVSHVECADDIKARYIHICMQELKAKESATVRDGGNYLDTSSDDDDESPFDDYFDDLLDSTSPDGTDTIH